MAVTLKDACAEILAMPADETITLPVEFIRLIAMELDRVSEEIVDERIGARWIADEINAISHQLEAVL